MTTIATEGWRNFMTMPAVTYPHGLKIAFFCCGYPHNWSVGYDGEVGDDQSSFVDITAERDSGGKNFRWTLMPRRDPANIKDGNGNPVYGGAVLDKYAREKPDPGYHIDYGTWVLPFRVVVERVPLPVPTGPGGATTARGCTSPMLFELTLTRRQGVE